MGRQYILEGPEPKEKKNKNKKAVVEIPDNIHYYSYDTSLITRHQPMPFHLLGHMLERLGQVFRTERQLASGPDLGVLFILAFFFEETRQATYGFQCLLDLSVESTGLEGDNRGRGLGVMGDGRAALAAEDTVDRLARRAIAGVGLGRTVQFQKVLGDDGDEGCR